MKKCLNCNKNIRRSIFSNSCSFCSYPQPTWSNKSLLSWWFMAAFIFLLAGVLISRIFFAILLLQSFYFFSMLRKRKHIDLKLNKNEVDKINDRHQKIKNLISIKHILLLSVALFVIYLVIAPKDGSKPNGAILALGTISFISFIICTLVLFIRLFKRILSPNRQLPIPKDDVNGSTIDNEITFTTSTKLGKSSQKQILKAKAQKSLKAEAKIEKKHNPVRSISYMPPTDEEEKHKDRGRYLKQNFDSKLKTLWRGSKNIEFSYSDVNDDISYRNVELNKVAINEYGDIYFSGICDSCDENRTFKTERIISLIEYDGEDYTIKQLFTDVLQISNNARSTKKSSVKKKETFDIHFTGFKKDDEDRLIKLAKAKDLTIRQSITQNLQVLCIGYNASQTKIAQAKDKQIPVMNENEFLHFLDTGEIG